MQLADDTGLIASVSEALGKRGKFWHGKRPIEDAVDVGLRTRARQEYEVAVAAQEQCSQVVLDQWPEIQRAASGALGLTTEAAAGIRSGNAVRLLGI